MFGKSGASISIGDRFMESNRERSEWSVEFVFGDPNGVPHARLRKLTDPTVARTFAVAVLMADPRFRKLDLRPTGAFGAGTESAAHDPQVTETN